MRKLSKPQKSSNHFETIKWETNPSNSSYSPYTWLLQA
jgi:hypothetical protein